MDIGAARRTEALASPRLNHLRGRPSMHVLPARSISYVGAALIAVLGLSGCTEDIPDPAPTAAPSSPPQSSVSVPNGPSLSPEASDDYERALARWTEYAEGSERYWAAGKVTPDAVEFFKEYWVTYPTRVAELEQYESMGLKASGIPEVKASWPDRVTAKDGIVTVVIKECIDASPVTFNLEAKGEVAAPYVRTVVLDRTEKRDFKVLSMQDLSNSKTVTPCGT